MQYYLDPIYSFNSMELDFVSSFLFYLFLEFTDFGFHM